jgi:hypothetical protein
VQPAAPPDERKQRDAQFRSTTVAAHQDIMPEKVAEVVRQAFTGDADETILDYVIAVLDDDHFDYGEDGEGAYEAFGEILVRGVPCELLLHHLRAPVGP